jgi:hypothetical protein
MQRLIIQTCVALVCASTAVFPYNPPANNRAKYNFNAGWKLFVGDPAGAERPDFDDSDWKSVTTPHAWNEDDAFKQDIKDLATGIAWYRKHFKLTPDSNGRRVFLETLTFPPIAGQKLKIELTGRPKDVDAFGQIVEVTGEKDAAAGKTEKGTLTIVEIEIYGPSR